MLKLYHSPRSRSSRFVWLLEEIGQPYEIEYVDIRRGDGTGQSDPRNPNPDGKVPTLVHDGRLVMESAAICLYLTDSFPDAGLGPKVGDPLRADYLTWLFFYSGEVEPALVAKFTGRVEKDEREQRSYDAIVRRFLGALERGPYILGDAFSAVDVLYGSIVQWGSGMLPKEPLFDAYLERLNGRPAIKRAEQGRGLMAEPINFNKARKARGRAEAEAKAAENRIKFGRTRAEKTLAKAREDKARRDIDSGKRER